MRQPLSARQLWSASAVGAAIIALVVYLVAASARSPAPRPSSPKKREQRRAARNAPKNQTSTSQRAFSAYQTILERNLFQPPVPPERPGTDRRGLPDFRLPPGRTGEDIPPPPPSVTAGWVYSGYALVDGEMIAFIENKATGECVFARPGDDFRGAAIVSVQPQAVTVNEGGRMVVLPKSDAYNAVPLGGGAQPRPAQSGARGPVAPVMGPTPVAPASVAPFGPPPAERVSNLRARRQARLRGSQPPAVLPGPMRGGRMP